MAARVLLLSILFTEVLKPISAAGVKGISGGTTGKDLSSKPEGLDLGSTVKGSGITLELEPSGHVILGRKGITLSCTGGTNHDISWLHNGVPAPPCGLARCTLLRNGSLHFYKKQNLQMVQKLRNRESNAMTISKNSKKDEYRCISRTNFGGLLRSLPAFLQVAELSHVFKESPEDLIVQEGEIARLSCLIDSVPFPPNITWQHNGETLLDFNDTKYFLVPPGVLYISATKLSDAGSYRCVATNELLKKTKRSKEAKLTVLRRSESGKRLLSSLFPQTTYNHWVVNGSSISLACAASGYPSPVVRWTFLSKSPGGTNVIKPRVLLNSTTGISILTLKNVSVSDAGIYECSSKYTANQNLQVQNISVEVLLPPTFIKKPTNQICPNGRTARFECQAQGVPIPQIYWLKDSLNITPNGRRTTYKKDFNKVELAISATVPSDSGVYQCVAVNSAGEIWAAGRLQVNTSRNSPATPTALKCHAVSPVKIFISWEPPKSLPSMNITAYTVHYSPLEGGKEEVSPEPGTSKSVEVTKLLEPFTNYSVYVRVWNNHGASDQSATIVCSTAPSVPKAAPKLSTDIISSTKLNVTWKPLSKAEARGVVVEYKVQWRLHQHPSTRVHYVPASVQHYTLNDLIPGAQYDLRVLARTEQGWPNITESQLGWTSVTMPSPESDQISIQNIVDIRFVNINTSVVLMKWKFIEEEEDFDLEFDSWQVYCENQEGEKITSVFLSRNDTEYLLTNLNSNLSYTVGFCMVNSGEAAGCLTRVLESSRFSFNDMPTALEAAPVSATSINLTWYVTDPSALDFFEVCYHAVHLADSENSDCVVADDTRATIENLKPFTLYQFKVRTLRNESNDSNPYSESIECYTNEDVPSKVEDVQWFFVNGTNVRVAWKEPRKINGIIRNYRVAYTMDLSVPMSKWTNVTVLGNKTSTILPGLLAGKNYFVVVQAATKAGYGKPSDPVIVFTSSSGAKVHTASDEQKPPPKPKPDQSLGVILGVSISVACITVCLCSIYCRRKCENSRSLRESAQPLKSRVLVRNGNNCCIDRSTTSVSQQVNVTAGSNEIELATLCPSTPISTNPQSDTKGGHSNGVPECAKEPLLVPDSNGDNKDVRITENAQQYKRGSTVSSNHRDQDEVDLETTQLTIINCTLDSSDSSLNNNFGCPEPNSLAQKQTATPVPILGPNG